MQSVNETTQDTGEQELHPQVLFQAPVAFQVLLEADDLARCTGCLHAPRERKELNDQIHDNKQIWLVVQTCNRRRTVTHLKRE